MKYRRIVKPRHGLSVCATPTYAFTGKNQPAAAHRIHWLPTPSGSSPAHPPTACGLVATLLVAAVVKVTKIHPPAGSAQHQAAAGHKQAGQRPGLSLVCTGLDQVWPASGAEYTSRMCQGTLIRYP